MISLGYVVAFVCGALVYPILKVLIRSFLHYGKAATSDTSNKGSNVYGLEHGVLNLPLPPSRMWMNLGYWRDQTHDPQDFPRACQALLERVLSAAFSQRQPLHSAGTSIHLLDVGFGCGDQTIFLLGAEPRVVGGPQDRPIIMPELPNTLELQTTSSSMRTLVIDWSHLEYYSARKMRKQANWEQKSSAGMQRSLDAGRESSKLKRTVCASLILQIRLLRSGC